MNDLRVALIWNEFTHQKKAHISLSLSLSLSRTGAGHQAVDERQLLQAKWVRTNVEGGVVLLPSLVPLVAFSVDSLTQCGDENPLRSPPPLPFPGASNAHHHSLPAPSRRPFRWPPAQEHTNATQRNRRRSPLEIVKMS